MVMQDVTDSMNTVVLYEIYALKLLKQKHYIAFLEYHNESHYILA